MTTTATTDAATLLALDDEDRGVALSHMSRRARKLAASAMRRLELDRRLAAERVARDAATAAGCPHCRRTETRTAQIWEPCSRCGTMPIYA